MKNLEESQSQKIRINYIKNYKKRLKNFEKSKTILKTWKIAKNQNISKNLEESKNLKDSHRVERNQ